MLCCAASLRADRANRMRTLVLQSIFDGPGGEAVRDTLVLKEQCASFYEQFKQTAAARVAALLLPTWLSHAQLTASQVESVCSAVISAGTWDELVLHGGATHTGDFVRVDGFRLQAAGFGRAEIEKITCSHTRSPVLGASYAALGWEPSVLVQAWARPDAATAAATTAATAGVTGTIGHATNWILASAVGGVGASAAPSMSARLPITSDVRFRPAGSRVDIVIPLNEVESITLSVPLSRPTAAARRRARTRSRSPSGSPAPRAAERSRRAADASSWVFVE